MKHHGQKFDQPSIFVTASTEKVATNINDTTLNFVFNLPVKQGFYDQPGAEVLHILRCRYAYLKIVLIDETLMTGLDTFNHLNKALPVINEKYFAIW